jgi:hypothetical protein
MDSFFRLGEQFVENEAFRRAISDFVYGGSRTSFVMISNGFFTKEKVVGPVGIEPTTKGL